MVEDIFGMPIKKGNIILLSKGDRGHKNFERGIVREFVITPKQIWIKTVLADKRYYEREDPNAVPHMYESKHLVTEGVNSNIILIADIDQKNVIDQKYLHSVKILQDSGEFPSTYSLGDSIESKEEEEVFLEKMAEVVLENADLLADLGMPSSLKKD